MDHTASSIRFAIPGTGVHTISIGSTLPTLTDTGGGTTIDGYSQPGSKANTDARADNAVIQVEIKGTGSSGPEAMIIQSPGNTVRGLAFYNLRQTIRMTDGGNDNVIAGNFLGTNAAGTFSVPTFVANSLGVIIRSTASRNIIGGPDVADRNVISGNSGRGVMIGVPGPPAPTDDNIVKNNIIGLTPNGLARLANRGHGVDINAGASRTIVEGNVVSGNAAEGVEVSHGFATDDNQIIHNRIGTDPSGTAGPSYASNTRENVVVEDGPERTIVSDNVIGNNILGGIRISTLTETPSQTTVERNRIGLSINGTPISNGPYGIDIKGGAHDNVIGPSNIIAHNRSGIRLEGDTTVHNTDHPNAIFSNSELGIDIAPLGVVDTAAVSTPTNGGIHFPVLSHATARSVAGQACSGCRVELFVADSTTTSPSLLSSFGEGRTFLAAANASRSGSFTIAFPGSSKNRLVTATATDSAGNTSEFSRNIAVPAGTPGPPPSPPFPSWDAFVARQLRDFRGSPGTAASRAAAVSQLTSGSVTPAALIARLMRQPYFGQNVAPVARLYLAYFGRVPDYHGLTYWAGRHRSGTPLIAISQIFSGSNEFGRVRGSLSDPEFVRFVYRSVLGRAPDARGLEYWVRRLKAGTPHGSVMAIFSESHEYRGTTAAEIDVVMAFAGMLHRAPTVAEVSTWTSRPVPLSSTRSA